MNKSDGPSIASTWKRFATISTTICVLAFYMSLGSPSFAKSVLCFKHWWYLISRSMTRPRTARRMTSLVGYISDNQLLQMVLQDAQTRLFFKAQSVIQSEIRCYTPTVQDLAYPYNSLANIVCFLSLDLWNWRSCTWSADWIRNSWEAELQPSIRRRGTQPARDLVSDTFQDRLGPLSATYITFVQVRFSEFFSCYAPVPSAGYPASYLQRPRTGGGGTVPRLVA